MTWHAKALTNISTSPSRRRCQGDREDEIRRSCLARILVISRRVSTMLAPADARAIVRILVTSITDGTALTMNGGRTAAGRARPPTAHGFILNPAVGLKPHWDLLHVATKGERLKPVRGVRRVELAPSGSVFSASLRMRYQRCTGSNCSAVVATRRKPANPQVGAGGSYCVRRGLAAECQLPARHVGVCRAIA